MQRLQLCFHCRSRSAGPKPVVLALVLVLALAVLVLVLLLVLDLDDSGGGGGGGGDRVEGRVDTVVKIFGKFGKEGLGREQEAGNKESN